MSESSTNTDKKYVHEGIEVVKTGRIAKKERQTAGRRATGGPTIIYEITPADRECGSWKKWVKDVELYEIVEQ